MRCAPAQASTTGGAFRYGRSVYVAEMRPVALVISGSVAVNWQGIRIGKGAVMLTWSRGWPPPE